VGRPRTVSDEQVLDAALAVLGELGVQGVTLALVAERCGVRAPSLSERFGSKRQLLLRAARRGAEAGVARITAATEAPGPACPAIVAALGGLAAGVGDRRGAAAMLSLLQLDVEDEELGLVTAEYMDTVRSVLRRLLERAEADGELVPADPAARALALQSAFHGSLLVWTLDRGTEPVADRARRVVDHLLSEWSGVEMTAPSPRGAG
jgi:AcrR family transcriptional regulator